MYLLIAGSLGHTIWRTFRRMLQNVRFCVFFHFLCAIWKIDHWDFFLSDLIYFSSILTDCPGTGSEQAGKGTACQGCPNQNICSSSKPLGPDPGNLIAFRSNIKLILHIAVMKISFFPISSGEMKNWKLCIVIMHMLCFPQIEVDLYITFLTPNGTENFPRRIVMT